eukprot:8875564-Karenia_brevis.AAC.1
MGASFSKLQKKIKLPKTIRADWRKKEFHIKATAEGEEKLLLQVSDDLSLVWDAEGVEVSGFSETELITAVA